MADSQHSADLRFEKFELHHCRDENTIFQSLIECYQNVFAEDPCWCEWKKCSVCGKKWGIEHRRELEEKNYICCGVAVVPFWPTEVVKRDIINELGHDHSSCWLAIHEGRVVGFCWGYGIEPESLEGKLELHGLAKRIRHRFGVDLRQVAYQDEIGVLKKFQNQGIAKKMFLLRLHDFLDNGLQIGVVRTKMNPPSVTYKWFPRIGYEVIGEYGDHDKKVVLARDIALLHL